jgi:hypothetical protein
MSDNLALAPVFQITIPVYAAREGSPDRGTACDRRIDNLYLVAQVPGDLMLAVQESIVPDFEKRFYDDWQAPAAEMWLSLARQSQRTADDLARVVAIMRERASAEVAGMGAPHG